MFADPMHGGRGHSGLWGIKTHRTVQWSGWSPVSNDEAKTSGDKSKSRGDRKGTCREGHI